MNKKHFWGLTALVIFCSFFLIEFVFGGSKMNTQTITIESSAFKNGGFIPIQYTCKGKNISPPLSWRNFPKRTASFAIIADDPDAPMGTWVHWVYYNIPSSVMSLSQKIETVKKPDVGGFQGTNDFHKIGYGGPCPPSGTHRYFFKIYALDIKLSLASGATKKALLKAMEGHILLEGSLMGKFSK